MSNLDNQVKELIDHKIIEIKAYIHEIECAVTRGDSDNVIMNMVISLSMCALDLEPYKFMVLDSYPQYKELFRALFMFNAQAKNIEAQYKVLETDASNIAKYINKDLRINND